MRITAAAFVVLALAATAGAGPVAIGDKLAPFSLKDATGREVDLKAFQGRNALVLMFIATRCPVSNDYNTRMASLSREYAGRGVAFLGINSNREEAPAEIADHASRHGFSFPVLKDMENVQADRFSAQVTPEVYVYDASWTLRYHGRIDDSRKGDPIQSHDLRNALDALLAGREVPVKETKAFGCTIKRVGP